MSARSDEKDLASLIPEILAKYDFPAIGEQFKPTPDTLKARVGFVGEFGSGKSTLINAMVGKKVLPARTDPTTRTIITVEGVPDIQSPERFVAKPDGELLAVNAADFSEIATGDQPGLLVVHVEPSPVMQPGLQIIDSPGMNSLMEGDSDLTISQLSLLDGLVVCLHQEHGAVPASLLQFLGCEEIASIGERLLFVLTFADLKSAESAERIRSDIERQILRAMPQLKVAPKLVFSDALGALDGKPEGIRDFARAFRESFVNRAESLRRERHEKHLKEVGKLLLTALRNHTESLAFDDSVFQKKEAELKAQININELAKARETSRLDEWYIGLRKAFDQETRRFGPLFVNAESDNLAAIGKEMDVSLQRIADAHVKRYAPGENLPVGSLPPDQASALIESLKAHSKYVERGVTLATMAATMAVASAAGAAAAASTEAGAAAAAAQAGGKEAAKQAAKQGGKEAAKQAAKQGSKTFLKKALGQLGSILKQINPLELVGDVVRNQWNDHTVAIHLPQIATQLSEAIHLDLKSHLEKTCFLPMANALMAAEEGLRETTKTRSSSLNELAAHKELAAHDLHALEATLGTHLNTVHGKEETQRAI